MVQATHIYHIPFHNLSNEVLADMLGQADAILKGAEAECKRSRTSSSAVA